MTRLVGLLVASVCALALAAGCASTGEASGSGARDGANAEGERAEGYTLSVTKLGIDRTPLAPVGLNPDRTIAVPPVDRPEQAAVYSGGPMPGSPGGGDLVGPAVVLGHVNGGGRPGVFARLSELAEGDTIQTTGPDGVTSNFLVYRTVTVEKADFPRGEVYSSAPTPELRLITCGGALDRSAHNYVGQVIVFARKVSP